jgi:hypothetical protein
MSQITFSHGIKLLIIGLTLTALIVCGYIWKTILPAEPIPWKTYNDPQHRFSFQYPGELFQITGLSEDNGLDGWIVSFNSWVDTTDRIYYEFPISDTLASTTGILSLLSVGVSRVGTSSCQTLGGPGQKYDLILPLNKLTVNGSVFTPLHVLGCGDGGCLEVYQYSIRHNGMCYKVDLGVVNAGPLDNANIPDSVEETQSSQVNGMLVATFKRIVEGFTLSD